MSRTIAAVAAVIVLGWSSLAVAEGPLFPFVVSYDSPQNVTNISAWLHRPAGKDGFVHNRDGHLATDAGPVRLWGTNLCFDGCFPTHEQAQRVATRLARLGINCVRIHHADAYAIWGDSPNKLTIDPQRLDLLDYFIDQLKQHGIYTNLNLHVSRSLGEREGFPNPERRPQFDKGVDNFEPRMIELQKKYSRDLLTHVNPYTKAAYTDEPAVAFIEISNEDALFAVWQWGQLEELPDPYASTLRKLWNEWLLAKYGDTDRLRAAWGRGSTTTFGDEMLRDGRFTSPLGEPWRVERDAQTKVDVATAPRQPGDGKASQSEGNVLRLKVIDPGAVSWNPQFVQGGLVVKKDVTYTLQFRLRSSDPRACEVQCQMAHEPWRQLGLGARVETGSKWQEHRMTFTADQDDPNARIVFNTFAKDVTYELAGVSLRPGGVVGLAPNQRLEDANVPLPLHASHRSRASDDCCDFLCDTERRYWREMYGFLKNELHVHSLVCGTQFGYSSTHVQAEFDYLDNHAYWQHPEFPNRSWDRKDWWIDDVALVNSPGGTLAHLAMGRVNGKPYTISEYNHPAPNSYAAEGFPMIAAFGAFQNWDGVYSFAYSHNRQYEPRQIEGFFDIKSIPVQLVHMPACVAMFVRGDVAPAKPVVFGFSQESERRQLHEKRNAWILTADDLLRDIQYPLLHATSLDLAGPSRDGAAPPFVAEGKRQLAAGRLVSDTGQICWDISQKDAGYFTVDTPRSKLFTGFVRGRTFTLDNTTLAIGPTRLDWATVSMTVIDGKGFDSGRILIAATGWTQNEGAKLERLDSHRITLRDQWGHEPVLCEGIPAHITLPAPPDRVKCYPLDESGNRRAAIPVVRSQDHADIQLDPRYKTLWYEVEVLPDS